MQHLQDLYATEDGSLSRKDAETGELFHNRAGAYTEALVNYVRPSGAVETLASKGCLRVLDACFGLGYNTWVLWSEAGGIAAGIVEIVGVDNDESNLPLFSKILLDRRLQQLVGMAAQPAAAVPAGMIIQPGMAMLCPCDKDRDSAMKMPLRYAFGNSILHCSLELHICDLRDILPKLDNTFDLVFHDPFSPSKVPELWTAEIFCEYHRVLSGNGGLLLTYSSAAAVRGAMIEAGFKVFRTTALGGKSGGTLGLAAGNKHQQVNPSCVFPLSKDEQEKVSSASGVPYRSKLHAHENRKDILERRALEQRTR